MAAPLVVHLTPKLRHVLATLAAAEDRYPLWDGVEPRYLARRIWPDHPASAGQRMNAGVQLTRLERMALVRSRDADDGVRLYATTNRGRLALASTTPTTTEARRCSSS